MKWAFHPDAAAGIHHCRSGEYPVTVRRRADTRRFRHTRLPAAAIPGSTAIATIFHADMGKTLLFGSTILLAILTVILPTGLRPFPERHR